MFYEEKRVAHEMFWSGFGFQAWCQMLTFVTKSSPGSLLIIDEPDIYLHSDLQRQLIQVLRDRLGDALIATHSTEMLGEAESGEIIVIDRKLKKSRKISRPVDLANIFTALGSVLNPILTQLSKTRRVVFVEGGDFGILGAFARKMGKNSIANQSGFAVVPAYGFNPARVRDFSDGMEQSLGYSVQRAVIFDRDYRLDDEIEKIRNELSKFCQLQRIHKRKELENFLLVPDAIARCVKAKLQDRIKRGAKAIEFKENIELIISNLIEDMKGEIFGQFSAKVIDQMRADSKHLDSATLQAQALKMFELQWNDSNCRISMAPGKKILARLNEMFQKTFSINVSSRGIVAAMTVDEIPLEMRELILALETFCSSSTSEQAT